MKISQSKKDKGVHCCAYHCTNKPIKKLGGLCYKHYQRKRRECDPVGVRYQQFKAKALKRKKFFNITLEEFRDWCNKTGYIIEKGKRGKRATVDRIKNKLGYTIDNIQLLTNKANAKKFHRQDKYEDDVPF